MGNEHSRDAEAEAEKREEVSDFLDSHPDFLGQYIDRNPHLLDRYVIDNVDEETVRGWLKKVEAPPPSEVLQQLRIDYLKKTNCASHHTDKYEHNSLIIRRAATFFLDIHFKNRGFLPAKDNIILEFSTGEKPNVANGTIIRVPVRDLMQSSKWTCMLVKNDAESKSMKVQVNVPSDAMVGRYKVTLEVATRLDEGPRVVRSTKPDIIVLFNPFNPADDVYMEDEVKRNEYVMNDTGIVYYGQYYSIGGMQWLFGQFESGILDIVLKLLRADPKVKKNPSKIAKKRSSPVYCSRALSAMVNSNDDDGVLYGRWDGEYADGVRPTVWTGSVKILKQWNESGMSDVKYGQCWVFSGVLTTALRALGIPARSITNFQSAHDTEFNMTIDRFVNDEGEESEYSTGDSIWNFHVWNEGWFRRPDLPKGYDGWQAVDATPQEESSGVFQCGPAPVTAVKNGEIYIGNDTNFLFAEVNADRLTWHVDSEGEVKALLKREARHVGRNISTKAVGSDEREDVTLQYKFAEDTEEERKSFERAYAFGKRASYHEKFDVIENEGKITIDIAPVGDVINGQIIKLSVKVTNTSEEAKTAVITTVINTMLHNDERKTLLQRLKVEVPIAAKEVNEKVFELKWEDYGRHLSDNKVIRVRTAVRVKETDNLYVDSHDVTVANPDMLTILCNDTLIHREYNDVTFTIVNTLPTALTEGVITMDGLGISTRKPLKLQEPIPSNSTYTTPPMQAKPYREGAITLHVDFDCNEIFNVKAEKKVQVAPA